MATLYLWAAKCDVEIPIFDHYLHLVGDHVWVTDYAPDCKGGGFPYPFPSNKRYWCCYARPDIENGHYNGCDPSENPLLGIPYRTVECDGDGLSMIENICPANNQSADAGVSGGTAYGVNGTCQQVANRILYFAEPDPLGFPPTCIGVTGWVLSFLWYGPYGRTAWPPEDVEATPDRDAIDFPEYIKGKIPPSLAMRVLGLRKELLEAGAKIDYPPDAQVEYAHDVNRLTGDFLLQAKQVVGDDRFALLFGGPYEKGVVPIVLHTHQ